MSIIKRPFIAMKKILSEYRLEYKYKGKTILILIIALHWIYGYAYITGSTFYEEYIQQAVASEYSQAPTKSNTELKENSNTPGTEEWIKEQWEEAGADWNEVWAVVQGESQWNSDAWMCNNIGSSLNEKTYALDAGLYELNSIHKIPLSCAINTICSTHEAIKIWKEQGWTPWVAANKLGIK